MTRRRRHASASPGAPTRPRTRATCCTCSTRRELARTLFPVGDADQGRGARAGPPRSACAPRPSPTARTCASSPGPTGGAVPRRADRAARRRAVVDGDGAQVGTVDAVELVTIGQRKGLGLAGGAGPALRGRRRRARSTVVTVGDDDRSAADRGRARDGGWSPAPVCGPSARAVLGPRRGGRGVGRRRPTGRRLRWAEPAPPRRARPERGALRRRPGRRRRHRHSRPETMPVHRLQTRSGQCSSIGGVVAASAPGRPGVNTIGWPRPPLARRGRHAASHARSARPCRPAAPGRAPVGTGRARRCRSTPDRGAHARPGGTVPTRSGSTGRPA